MRKDYEYVKSATDLGFSTTKSGDKWLEEIMGDEELNKKKDATVEVLSVLQNDYVLVEKGEIATMPEFLKSLRKWFEEHRDECSYTDDDIESYIMEAELLWKDGHIGVVLIIWD